MAALHPQLCTNLDEVQVKGVSVDLYSAEQILHFADEMNALPRKQLGYRTPDELFEEFLDKVYSLDNPQVA